MTEKLFHKMLLNINLSDSQIPVKARQKCVYLSANL